MKDENINLISRLEEATSKIMQLEQAAELRGQEHRTQIQNIETEIQKYL